LIAQGDLRDLHFDIKDNRVIQYDRPKAVEDIVRALVEGARAFEAALGYGMEVIRRSLSPQAVYLLNLYGRLRKSTPGMSLHARTIQDDPNVSIEPANRELVFNNASQQLQDRGLLTLDYAVADDQTNPDRFGLHATALGMVFIRQTWPTSLGDLK